jgi:GNAT superfamily N-acetyltransferase
MDVRVLDGVTIRDHLDGLADVLHDCVEGGASVSFMAPFSREEARAFFEDVADEVEAGRRILLAAVDDGRVVGTVQVLLAMPPNQPHRGEIAKLLVHRDARGRGCGGLLMRAAEGAARDAGKTLLVLDTASAAAERVYERGGWTRVGTVPGYALLPGGEPCDTVFYWKRL